MRSRVLPELQELSDQLGDFVAFWGFKKVHGRLWAHLYLSAEPLDATELMRRLSISKALASVSLAELLQYEVIQRVGKGRRGRVLYAANPHVLDVITNVVRTRERRLLLRIGSAYRLLKAAKPEELRAQKLSREQIAHLGHLIEGGTVAIESFVRTMGFDLSGIACS